MISIAPYYKAVTAGVGEIVTATTAITSLLTLVSDQFHGVAVGASILIGVLGVAKPIYVYLVANEPLAADVDTAVVQAEPIVKQIEKAAAVAQTTPPTS